MSTTTERASEEAPSAGERPSRSSRRASSSHQSYTDPSYEVSAGWVARLFRYWPVTLVLVVAGTAIGYGIGGGRPVTYTAEERIAVGYQNTSLSAGATAGYAAAAAQLASNYSRYINDDALAGTAAAGNAQVEGTPIDDANVIRVVATSGDSATAIKAATTSGKKLIDQINAGAGDNTPDALYAQFQAASAKWSKTVSALYAAQAALNAGVSRGGDTTALRDQLAQAQQENADTELLKNGLSARYNNAVVSGGASTLSVISPASSTTSDHKALVMRWTLLGLGIGLVVALLIASISDGVRRQLRRSRRRSGRSERAAGEWG